MMCMYVIQLRGSGSCVRRPLNYLPGPPLWGPQQSLWTAGPHDSSGITRPSTWPKVAHSGSLLLRYRPGSTRDLISKLGGYGWALSTHRLDHKARGWQTGVGMGGRGHREREIAIRHVERVLTLAGSLVPVHPWGKLLLAWGSVGQTCISTINPSVQLRLV